MDKRLPIDINRRNSSTDIPGGRVERDKELGEELDESESDSDVFNWFGTKLDIFSIRTVKYV